jgi:ELWxxDGT repeat protein
MRANHRGIGSGAARCAAGTGGELWQWSGASGPLLVDDIAPGSAGSDPTELTPVGNVVYFAANDGSGEELWLVGIPGD